MAQLTEAIASTSLVIIDTTVENYSELALGVQINGGDIDAIADTAIQQVALLGDSNRDRTLSNFDASLIARVAVGLDSGFDAFPITDPAIVADLTGDGALTGLDAAIAARTAAGFT